MKQPQGAQEAIRLLIQAYENIDIEGVLRMLTEQVIWIGTGWHEHRIGREAVRALLIDDFSNSPVPYAVDIHEMEEIIVSPDLSCVFAVMDFAKTDDSSMSIKSRSTFTCVNTGEGYRIGSWHCSVGTSLLLEHEYFPITFANDILQRATVDALTEIMNRASFERLVTGYLAGDSSAMAYILVDLDDFKFVNDRYGHNIGDGVLRFAAQQLKKTFEGIGLIGRLGGDEFVVFLPAVEAREQLGAKVEEFLSNLSQAIHIDTFIYTPSASVGVFFKEAGREADYELCYTQADSAMYGVKRDGKGKWKMV